jgi:hypothetical protein
MYYVFDLNSLKKSVETCDDIAVHVLWDRNKDQMLVATALKMVPAPDDDVVATMGDADITELYKFSAGALDGLRQDNKADLCAGITKKYGRFIADRKKDMQAPNAA